MGRVQVEKLLSASKTSQEDAKTEEEKDVSQDTADE